MKHLTLILLLWSSFTFAQKSEFFRIDGLPKEGILLDKGWKWHAGDDPEWAKADFDDAGWEEIDPTKDIYDLKQVRRTQIGWLRLKIWVDSSLIRQPLAINLIQSGAHEIYLNQKLITHIGKVSKDPVKEKTYTSNGRPYALYFERPGEQLLAVRSSFTKKNYINNHRGVGNRFFQATINWMNPSISLFFKNQNFNSILDYLKCGFYLYMGLLHLFLYFSFKSSKANFYFGLFGLFTSILFYFNNFVIMPTDFQLLYWYKNTIIVLAMMLLTCALLSTYTYVNAKKGIQFWSIIVITLTGLPVYMYSYTWGALYALVFIQFCFAIENSRVSFIAIKQGNHRALFLMLGWILYMIFFSIYMMIALRVLRLPSLASDIVSNLAFFSIAISYTLLLSGDFARTNKILREKLAENEKLSAQTLAQEQEKQQLLASQNETLERQVTTRTAELNQSLETLKATQTQLIEREKLASLGELTAGIAHEIQNPLNFVNNFAEVSTELVEEMTDELGKGNQGEADAIALDLKQNLEKINYHGKRASSIVKNMLEHSRTNAGDKETTDINALIDECLRLSYHGMRGQFRNFQADYGLNLASHLPNTKVVKQDLGRVLLNLFNNAFYTVHERMKQLEGTQPHDYVPKVSASTSKLKNGIEIRIKDNGTGIPEALKTKIFQPFFTTKPTGEGTGLGLSLSYEIITKGHGGSLSIESAEGNGTTFIIELPFEPKT